MTITLGPKNCDLPHMRTHKACEGIHLSYCLYLKMGLVIIAMNIVLKTALMRHMLVAAAQVLIMMALGEFFSVNAQSIHEWAFAAGVGAGTLLVNLLTKLLTRGVRQGMGAVPKGPGARRRMTLGATMSESTWVSSARSPSSFLLPSLPSTFHRSRHRARSFPGTPQEQ